MFRHLALMHLHPPALRVTRENPADEEFDNEESVARIVKLLARRAMADAGDRAARVLSKSEGGAAGVSRTRKQTSMVESLRDIFSFKTASKSTLGSRPVAVIEGAGRLETRSSPNRLSHVPACCA